MIKIIKEYDSNFNKENSLYIGRGSIFGNYSFSIKGSIYNLPKLKEQEQWKTFFKDFEDNLKKNPKFKNRFNSLVKKFLNNNTIVLKCFCIDKNINDINNIDLNNIKCHGEYLAKRIIEESLKLENNLIQEPPNF